MRYFFKWIDEHDKENWLNANYQFDFPYRLSLYPVGYRKMVENYEAAGVTFSGPPGDCDRAAWDLARYYFREAYKYELIETVEYSSALPAPNTAYDKNDYDLLNSWSLGEIHFVLTLKGADPREVDAPDLSDWRKSVPYWRSICDLYFTSIMLGLWFRTRLLVQLGDTYGIGPGGHRGVLNRE